MQTPDDLTEVSSHRMVWRSIVAGILSLVVFFGVVPPVQAKDSTKQSNQSELQRKAKAAAKAKREHGGRVLKVTPSGGNHRVKILTPSGSVKNVIVNTDDD